MWFKRLKVSERLNTEENIIKINIKQLSGYGHVNLLGELVTCPIFYLRTFHNKETVKPTGSAVFSFVFIDRFVIKHTILVLYQYLYFCTVLYLRIYFREHRSPRSHVQGEIKYSTTILCSPEMQTFQPWDKVTRNSFPYYSKKYLFGSAPLLQFSTVRKRTKNYITTLLHSHHILSVEIHNQILLHFKVVE